MKYLFGLLLATPLYYLSSFALPDGPDHPAINTAPMATTELSAPLPSDTAPAASPVVLELFTSQGCSSCPPADELLAKLADEPDVIALSFHVDYWNYLGWKDPFSSPYFSARQRDYTEALRARTYTPQLLVNGRREMIGSRLAAVKAALASARAEGASQSNIHIELSSEGTDQLQVDYTLDGPLNEREVIALLVQDEAVSSIKRGENRGRELHHVNVVRELKSAEAKAGGSFSFTLPEGVSQAETHVVLLVQDAKTFGLYTAARSSLSAR